MEELKKQTTSLCGVCRREISASVYAEDGKVKMKKNCPEHGEFLSLVENDSCCYKILAHLSQRKHSYFHTLTFPFTYKCVFNCEFCYLPDRGKKDLSMNEIKESIENFKGDFIGISGGEPTLREELPEIISFIRKTKKISILYTTGVAFTDIRYLRTLKKAGLDRVLFSFDGFKEDIYRTIKICPDPERMVERKLQALENLKKEEIQTILSMTIYNGINESEIKKVFDYAVKNNSFVCELRLRSCATIGKYKEEIEGYFMSDLLKIFEKETSIETYSSLRSYLCKYTYYTPHSIDLKLYYCYIKNKTIPLVLLAKATNFIMFCALNIAYSLKIEKICKNIAYRLVGERPFIKHLILHFAQWPTLKNIDLGELEAGVAHLYGSKVLNFCHAVSLNEKL